MKKYEKYERIGRTVYAEDPNADPGPRIKITGFEIENDFLAYHDVRARIHEQAEHDLGVASGLEVVVEDMGFALQVKPGVAVDGSGQVIVLASEDVESAGRLGRINTRRAPADKTPLVSPAYVTVRFRTVKGDNSYNTDMSSRRVKPRVQLMAPGDLDDESRDKRDQTSRDKENRKDGETEAPRLADGARPYHVVLAVVELEADGKVKSLAPAHSDRNLCPLGRKLVGVPAGEIRLRRSKATKDGDKETVSDTVAVTLRPTEHGVEIVGATETFRLDVTQTGTQKLAGMTFGATYVEFDQDIQTDKKIDGRDVSEDGKKLDEHLANKQNPHGVTLQQLGPLSTDGKTLKVAGDIDASGYVGINTGPDPNHRLKVTGNIHCDSISTGTPGEQKARMTTDGSIYASGTVECYTIKVVHGGLSKMPDGFGGVHAWDVFAEATIGSGKDGAWKSYLQGGDIYASGYVGINTGPDPNHRLKVTGNIHCDSISTGTPGEQKARMTTDGSIHASGTVECYTIKVVHGGLSKMPDVCAGVHAWDVFAEGTIGCGKDGAWKSYLQGGNIYASGCVGINTGPDENHRLKVAGNIHCDSISTGTPGEVKARMTTDGSIHATGNVGIGAAPDPKHRLTVVGGTDQRWFAEFRPGAQTFTSAPKIGPEGSTPGTSSRRARSAAAKTANQTAIWVTKATSTPRAA